MSFSSVLLPAPLRPTSASHVAGLDRETELIEDGAGARPRERDVTKLRSREPASRFRR